MIVTEDEELYQILLSLRAHGWTRDLPRQNLVCRTKSDDPFKESFRFVLPGYNVRPLELSGAIGLKQVEKLGGLLAMRRHNARRFVAMMADYPQFRVQKEIGNSSWFGFSLVVDADAPFGRQEAVEAFRRRQIETRPIVAGNFARNEVVRWFNHEAHGQLKNADLIDTNGFFIGNHHYALDGAFALVRDALNELTRRI